MMTREFEIISPKTFNECYNWFLLNSDEKTECFIECKRGKPQDGIFHYLDAVYCALCFGWIDSVCKKINGKVVQRFSPRRKNSPWPMRVKDVLVKGYFFFIAFCSAE